MRTNVRSVNGACSRRRTELSRPAAGGGHTAPMIDTDTSVQSDIEAEVTRRLDEKLKRQADGERAAVEAEVRLEIDERRAEEAAASRLESLSREKSTLARSIEELRAVDVEKQAEAKQSRQLLADALLEMATLNGRIASVESSLARSKADRFRDQLQNLTTLDGIREAIRQIQFDDRGELLWLGVHRVATASHYLVSAINSAIRKLQPADGAEIKRYIESLAPRGPMGVRSEPVR